ncbi:MAG: hypothetical protein R2699_10590 [Acidimicrobiales bacterium]
MLPVDVALPTEIADRLGVATMTIRPMVRGELDKLVAWAAGEGWNGLDDAEVFWTTDPDGFVAAAIGDELIGGGSIVSYDGSTASWGSSSSVRSAPPRARAGAVVRSARHAAGAPRSRCRHRARRRRRHGALLRRRRFAVGHRDQRYEAIGVPQGTGPPTPAGTWWRSPTWRGMRSRPTTPHVPAPRPTFLERWVRRRRRPRPRRARRPVVARHGRRPPGPRRRQGRAAVRRRRRCRRHAARGARPPPRRPRVPGRADVQPRPWPWRNDGRWRRCSRLCAHDPGHGAGTAVVEIFGVTTFKLG